MKLVEQSYKIVEQEPGTQGIYRAIEQAGRTCYKSEDKITDTSADEFVKRMINSKHYAMLEFGTVYLKCPIELYYTENETIEETANGLSEYLYNPYSIGIEVWNADNSRKGYCYVTTNLRVLVENDWLYDLKYLCVPTEFHKKRVCVKFVCDRGVSHELVRHRPFSYAQESTRYCNYSKDKFCNQLTFIIPSFLSKTELIKYFGDIENLGYDKDIHKFQTSEWSNAGNFLQSIAWSEANYLTLIHNKLTPQEARAVLPNCLKTEINMCGFISDWEHVFELRDNSHAHPDMQVLMKPLHEEFKKKFKIK